MALNCGIVMNTQSYSAGQTQPPMATLVVSNPNAVAVVVTGVQITYQVDKQTNYINAVSAAPSLAPIGPGQTTSVPANGQINIGPFPVSVPYAGNANPYQSVPQAQGSAQGSSQNLLNPQAAEPPSYVLQVGATVIGSDGSSNTASTAPLVISYYPPSPPGFQGGVLQFFNGNNEITGLVTGVL